MWIDWPDNHDDYNSPPHDARCFVKLRNGEVLGPDLVSRYFDLEGGVGGWYYTGDEFDIVKYMVI